MKCKGLGGIGFWADPVSTACCCCCLALSDIHGIIRGTTATHMLRPKVLEMLAQEVSEVAACPAPLS